MFRNLNPVIFWVAAFSFFNAILFGVIVYKLGHPQRLPVTTQRVEPSTEKVVPLPRVQNASYCLEKEKEKTEDTPLLSLMLAFVFSSVLCWLIKYCME